MEAVKNCSNKSCRRENSSRSGQWLQCVGHAARRPFDIRYHRRKLGCDTMSEPDQDALASTAVAHERHRLATPAPGGPQEPVQDNFDDSDDGFAASFADAAAAQYVEIPRHLLFMARAAPAVMSSPASDEGQAQATNHDGLAGSPDNEHRDCHADGSSDPDARTALAAPPTTRDRLLKELSALTDELMNMMAAHKLQQLIWECQTVCCWQCIVHAPSKQAPSRWIRSSQTAAPPKKRHASG